MTQRTGGRDNGGQFRVPHGGHTRESYIPLAQRNFNKLAIMRERRGREQDGVVPLYFVLSPTMTQAGIQSLVRPAFPSAGVQCHLEGGLSGLRVGGERKRAEGQRWAPLVEKKHFVRAPSPPVISA